jgi:hypothetical protein
MYLYNLLVIILFILVSVAGGCSDGPVNRSDKHGENTVRMTFEIELNQQVYRDSSWADPPQMAIWLQNENDRSVRTVFVTYRMGACYWDGKIECGVALPFWVGFYNQETGTTGPPTWDNPAPDAVTCATPTNEMTAHMIVGEGSKWNYFIEVNVSGDFNADFPSFTVAGRSDRYGNGQPSLVYRGTIDAVDGVTSWPELFGRTDQYEPVRQIIENTEGIITAKQLLQSIKVSCRKDMECATEN